MRNLIKTAGLLGLVIINTLVYSQTKNQPNIIIIMADDLGYGDLSCYGHPTIKTPYLDQMAAEGMRFTQFYSAASVCTPSRAGLMTGRLPVRSGMHSSTSYNNIFPWSKSGLPESETTIAEALKARNYQTGMIGKWHLGILPQYMPNNHGFDFYYGVPYSNDMLPKPKNTYPPLPMYRNDKVEESGTDQSLITQKYTVEAVNFIKKNKNKPFFLYYASNAPHVPLHPSKEFEGKSKRGPYGDVVQELDWSVGQVLKTLKDLKIDKNTLVLFCSDNGPWLKRFEEAGSAGLLSAGKGTAYEGGSRVPAIAWWPGTISPKQINEAVVGSLDFFPTAVILAGGKPEAGKIYDGRNIHGELTQRTYEHDNVTYYYIRDKVNAVRKGAWKIVFSNDEIWPVTEVKPLDKPLLFNLENDPSEKYDLSTKNPEKFAELKKIHQQHIEKVIPGPSELDKR